MKALWRYHRRLVLRTHRDLVDVTMASNRKSVALGCQVTIPASWFDDPEAERWSVQQFGDEADTRALPCKVVARVRGLWRVHVEYDATTYVVEESAFTHTAATCRSCWPNVEANSPSAPSSAPVGLAAANRGRMSQSGPGTLICNFAEALPESEDCDLDDDLVIAELAAALVQRRHEPHAAVGETHEGPRLDAPQARGRDRRPTTRSVGRDVEWDSADDSDLPSLTNSESESESEADDTEEEENPRQEERLVSRGRGRAQAALRGRGRGRAGPVHDEDDTTIKRHGLVWTKGVGRTVDPMLTGNGYSARARPTLYGYTESSVLEWFQHCFPHQTVAEIATEVEISARQHGKSNFSCSPGRIWLFLALKLFMLIHPQEGPKEYYWGIPGELRDECVYVNYDLGQYGMSLYEYKDIERFFRLPGDHDSPDKLAVVRSFVDSWNANMHKALVPGAILVVDESMAGWRGRGMPGLMTVPRKPTPVGREAHTTADAETGVVIFYELYEGKDRMANKEYVQSDGKNPAKALRCVKPWFSTGRLVILDSGFASVSCALSMMDKGLYMIGNVKSGTKKFPKDFLINQVPRREDRYCCTAKTKTPGGLTVDLLAAADMDKQPMALVGTAGTSTDGQTLTRKFTVIRPDGTFHVREASLKQMQIHERYRAFFNALDKHNAIRQGNACLETSWKTKRWYIRDFQALFGMSMVNAYLMCRRFSKRQELCKISYTIFQRKLCYMMLRHPKLMVEREEARTRARRSGLVLPEEVTGHQCLKIGTTACGAPIKRACIFCSQRTELYCGCTPIVNKKGIYVCSTGTRPECHARHIAGEIPLNRKSEAAAAKWEKKRAAQSTDHYRNKHRR